MKVVQELVAYFDRRGQLSKKEVRQLLDKGYLASDAPPHMLELAGTVGATYYFRVRGETEGPLWGTDIYTGDFEPGGRSRPCRSGQAGRDRDPEGDDGSALARIQRLAAAWRHQSRFRPLRQRLQAIGDLERVQIRASSRQRRIMKLRVSR